MENSTLTLIFFTLIMTFVEYLIFEAKISRALKPYSGWKKFFLVAVGLVFTTLINGLVFGFGMLIDWLSVWEFMKHLPELVYIKPKIWHRQTAHVMLIGCAPLALIALAISQALYYAKGNKGVTHPLILLWLKNIHRITWFRNALFFLVFILANYLGFFMWVKFALIHAVVISYLAMFCVRSFDWQKWINRGSGLPDIDPNEDKTTELVLPFIRKHIELPRWNSKMDRIRDWVCTPVLISLSIYLIFL